MEPTTIQPMQTAAALEQLLETAWAMRPSAIRALYASAQYALTHPVSTQAASARYSPTMRSSGGTAVIPIRGVITLRPTLFGQLFGSGTSVEGLQDELSAALADDEVHTITLDIDSPGGSTDGLPELAAEIYSARGKKKVQALVNTTAASAAYWLASQASEILVAPSGSVGSIGVYGLHLDHSRELEAAGITPTFIRSTGSPWKVEENPLEPLSEDAQATIQSRIDVFYAMFTRDVARGRGIPVDRVRSDFGEGRMVLAADAVRRGMADKVTGRPGVGGGGLSASDLDVDASAALALAQASATLAQIAAAAAPSSRALLVPHEISLSALSPSRRRLIEHARLAATHELRARDYTMRLFRPYDGQTVAGVTYLELREIWVCVDARPGEMVNTLIHEMAHVSGSLDESKVSAYAFDIQRRLAGAIELVEREEWRTK